MAWVERSPWCHSRVTEEPAATVRTADLGLPPLTLQAMSALSTFITGLLFGGERTTLGGSVGVWRGSVGAYSERSLMYWRVAWALTMEAVAAMRARTDPTESFIVMVEIGLLGLF